MTDDGKALWINWMSDGRNARTRQRKPPREVRFWTDGVHESTQALLTDYLREREHQPLHYASVSAAVYALRQLGYVRRTITEKDILTWLSNNLSHDYSAQANAHRFRNVWSEYGRYKPAIKAEVNELAQLGITTFKNS